MAFYGFLPCSLANAQASATTYSQTASGTQGSEGSQSTGATQAAGGSNVGNTQATSGLAAGVNATGGTSAGAVQQAPVSSRLRDAPADPTNIYVGGPNANDTTGNGTQAAPYATLAYALSQASTSDASTVYLLSDISASIEATVQNGQDVTITSYDPDPADNDVPAYTIYRDSADAQNTNVTGNMLYVSQGSTATITDVVFDGNSQGDAGAGNDITTDNAAIGVAGALSATDVTIYDNDNTSNGESGSGNGGGIAITGDAANVTLNGCTVTKNTASLGSGIYYATGALTLSGAMQIGTSDDDNGIYEGSGKTVSISGTFGNTTNAGGTGGAGGIGYGSGATIAPRVNIDSQVGGRVGSAVANQASATTTDATNLAALHYTGRAYTVTADGTTGNEYTLAMGADDWYVDGTNGNDDTCTGAQSAPYQSISRLISAIPHGDDVALTVNVLNDAMLNQDFVLSDISSITFIGTDTSGSQASITREDVSGNTYSMFEVDTNISMTLDNITVDGNAQATDPQLTSCQSAVTVNGGSLTMQDATITNNSSNGNGGGVSMSFGDFSMKGASQLTGNSANGSGGEAYFYTGTMTISGTPNIGSRSGNDGVYIGPGAIIQQDGDLASQAMVYISGASDAQDGLSVIEQVNTDPTNDPVSATGAAHYSVCDGSYAIVANAYGATGDADHQTYDLQTVSAYYVADPNTAPSGANIPLGSDDNSGTSPQAPF
ncbi:MAG: hypothetical protein LBM21_02865, partial [Coriobacteriales bacterium]|nr:hypothetical protein [Coriobacteriales bacterium]